MIDFHTHILSDIDDGAEDLNTSVAMIEKLMEQGVNKIVLTPHFYTDSVPVSEFVKNRDAAYKKLKSKTENLNVDLILASETYLTDYLFNNDDISDICIGSSRYLLTELPIDYRFSSRNLGNLNRIISDYNVVPILAHVDRYSRLIRDYGLMQEITDMGLLMQLNLYALDSSYFMRRKLLRYMEKGYISCFGTDCHDLLSFPPEYKRYIDIIRKYMSEDYIDRISDVSEKILNS